MNFFDLQYDDDVNFVETENEKVKVLLEIRAKHKKKMAAEEEELKMADAAKKMR